MVQSRSGIRREGSEPLVVDLDGTLLNSDMLVEALFSFLRSHPLNVFQVLAWLFRGKAYLKSRLSEAVEPDVGVLPYNATLLARLREERAHGRPVWLATATHQRHAEAVADHLGVFDGVLATTEETNLRGKRKRDELVDRFGHGGFDYVGNDSRDLEIWPSSREAWVVNPELGVELKARRLANVTEVIRTRPSYVTALSTLLRLHQWSKNTLIFVPLASSHQIFNPLLLIDAILAFVVFGLCASAVYLLNDLLDLHDDRRHPTKCARPLASGAFPINHALVLAFGLLLLGFGLAIWLLPSSFVTVLAVYFALTCLYSLYLKRVVMVDVITLAFLYTLRIIAGAAACGLTLTFWILAFSVFIFLSLAMVKRYAELHEMRDRGEEGNTGGRDYRLDDLQMVSSLGGASGYLSVLVLALYLNDPTAAALYSHPEYIWLACPILLFWISRTWLLTHRGLMSQDPVVFALKDRTSQLTGVVFLAVFLVAL